MLFFNSVYPVSGQVMAGHSRPWQEKVVRGLREESETSAGITFSFLLSNQADEMNTALDYIRVYWKRKI